MKPIRSRDDPARQRLRPVRQALLDLHKGLLDGEREQYEQTRGRVSPTELLQLLLRDQAFAWLRSISELIVRIDEMSEAEEPPTDGETEQVLALVQALLSQEDETTDFARRYARALQRSPATLVNHGRVMRALEASRSGPTHGH